MITFREAKKSKKWLLKNHLKPEDERGKKMKRRLFHFGCQPGALCSIPLSPPAFSSICLCQGLKRKTSDCFLVSCFIVDLLKTNFKAKVIIFESLQDSFRNWLKFSSIEAWKWRDEGGGKWYCNINFESIFFQFSLVRHFDVKFLSISRKFVKWIETRRKFCFFAVHY